MPRLREAKNGEVSTGVRVEAFIKIGAPADVVWRIATDPELAPRWNDNVMRVEEISENPIAVGTRWTQVVRILGRDEVMHGEVVDCDPPHRGTVRLDGPGVPVILTTIQSADGGVVLSQTMDITVPSGLTGVAMRLGLPIIKGQLEEALRRQKAAAEKESAGS